MKTPEGKIKDEIRKFLKDQGAYVFSPVQMGFGAQTLDLLVCLAGQFIAIEVKAPGKKLTARQKNTIKEIKAAGGSVFVAHSVIEVRGYIEGFASGFVEGVWEGLDNATVS